MLILPLNVGYQKRKGYERWDGIIYHREQREIKNFMLAHGGADVWT